MKRFRGGVDFKAHRLVYHSTPGSRVLKKKKKEVLDGHGCGGVVLDGHVRVEGSNLLGDWPLYEALSLSHTHTHALSPSLSLSLSFSLSLSLGLCVCGGVVLDGHVRVDGSDLLGDRPLYDENHAAHENYYTHGSY